MHVADLVIDQSQQQIQQLVRTYEGTFGLDNTFVSAEGKFEHDCLTLSEDGWRLKQVSHRGSIVFLHAIVARYEKE
jgi:hypothetical protein